MNRDRRRAEAVELLATLFDVAVVAGLLGGLLRVGHWLATTF